MDKELKASIDRLRESLDSLREVLVSRVDQGERDEDDAIQQRLQVLARLDQDGLISEDEYSERKDQMLRDWSF